MMKNVLIVFTVLAMASVANASLLISVDGRINPPDTEITLKPSEHVVIDISGDGQTPSPQGMYLASVGLGVLNASGAVLKYPGTLNEMRQVDDPAEIAYLEDGMKVAGITSAVYVMLADGAIPPAALDGTLVDMIDFHCTGQPGDVMLYLAEYQGFTLFDTQVIHQIPEPITFALLGLGGLFLRRRK